MVSSSDSDNSPMPCEGLLKRKRVIEDEDVNVCPFCKPGDAEYGISYIGSMELQEHHRRNHGNVSTLMKKERNLVDVEEFSFKTEMKAESAIRMHQCEFCEFGTKAFNVGFSSYGELSRHVHECHPYAFQNLHAWMIQCSMCLAPPCNRKNLEMHMFAMHDMDNPTFEESFANTAQFCAWLAAYQSVSGDVYTQVSRYDLDGVKHMEFVCDWKQNGDDVSSPKCLASIKLRWEQIVEITVQPRHTWHTPTFSFGSVLELQYATREKMHIQALRAIELPSKITSEDSSDSFDFAQEVRRFGQDSPMQDLNLEQPRLLARNRSTLVDVSFGETKMHQLENELERVQSPRQQMVVPDIDLNCISTIPDDDTAVAYTTAREKAISALPDNMQRFRAALNRIIFPSSESEWNAIPAKMASREQ